MRLSLVVSIVLALACRTPASGTGAHPNRNSGSQAIPSPAGVYVLDDASNERTTSSMYAAGLFTSAAYTNDVTGHAIFVPIAKILPAISTWGQFNWDWKFLDTLLQLAVSHGKKFSIELETGYQASNTYLLSLPSGFIAAAGTNSAPLFNVWTTGGSGGRCITAYVLLPWNTRVQQFWSAAAAALADHLHSAGVYDSLTLVHLPGLSVYDEEIRLPSGVPRPAPSDTLPCPDGRPAYRSVITDADTGRWRTLGYSDTAAINGFTVIARAFALAFPDRVLGLSLFPPGPKGDDFPNLTLDTAGAVAARLVGAVSAIAPGRVQVQADNLDGNYAEAEVRTLAALNADRVGWQTNKHAETGAGCNGGGVGSCGQDGPAGPYFQLLKNGAVTGGEYIEVWSTDVVTFPQSFTAARSAGYYTVTDVPSPAPALPSHFGLEQNYPNPFNPATSIAYEVSARTFVTLKVYDILGRVVSTLVNDSRQPGRYKVDFDAAGLSSGVYVYRLQAGNDVEARSMVYVR